MLTIPFSFFRACNLGEKSFLCRRHRTLEARFETVLSAFLQILVQNFGKNKCSRFHFHSSELPISLRRGFCTEGVEHSKHTLGPFCPHFFKSFFKILTIINVDHSICMLPSFQFPVKSGFCTESTEHSNHVLRRSCQH